VPGAFVVNIGDMLELWTNGAFVATRHRVRKVVEERYSFPLFFNVDYDTEVKPLAQFSSRDAQQRPALRAGEHLFAQTAQTFAYLRKRIHSGELALPDGSLETGQFGQQARYRIN
jgi:isopenicillin N synthase-like dioxygenase